MGNKHGRINSTDTQQQKNESTCKLYAQITFFMRQKIAVNSIDIEQKKTSYIHIHFQITRFLHKQLSFVRKHSLKITKKITLC